MGRQPGQKTLLAVSPTADAPGRLRASSVHPPLEMFPIFSQLMWSR